MKISNVDTSFIATVRNVTRTFPFWLFNFLYYMSKQENIFLMILVSCSNHFLDIWHHHPLLEASQNKTKFNGIEEINSFEVLPIIALITSSIEDKVIFFFFTVWLIMFWNHLCNSLQIWLFPYCIFKQKYSV